MTNCAKCDQYAMEKRLIGGYETRLCAAHRNEWHEYIFLSTAYRDFRDISVELKAAIAVGDKDEALVMNHRLINAEWRLYEIAKEWCES